MKRVSGRFSTWVERLGRIGVAPGDTDEIRVQKVALTVSAVTASVLSVVWVATYLALGLPVSAAIPFSYQVIAIAGLIVLARTKDHRFFRFSQLALSIVLPFVLQWSLGGYVASSAVSLWALEGTFGALFFYSPRDAIPWYALFLALTALSGLVDPLAAQHAASIPAPIQDGFFVLNIFGASITAYLLLQYAVRARNAALASSERLLLNVLPRAIAERLKHETGVIADTHAAVTVVFADVVDFTAFTERTPPAQVVGILDEIFTAFDRLAERLRLEKIKTIGDAYMVVAGLPDPRPDHVEAAAEMALGMRAELARLGTVLGLDLAIRIGIDSGPVIAGVIGKRKFIYDLWGDTVNTASRMESTGISGQVQVTETVFERLRDRYAFEARGEVAIKGKGRLRTYLLTGHADPADAPPRSPEGAH